MINPFVVLSFAFILVAMILGVIIAKGDNAANQKNSDEKENVNQ